MSCKLRWCYWNLLTVILISVTLVVHFIRYSGLQREELSASVLYTTPDQPLRGSHDFSGYEGNADTTDLSPSPLSASSSLAVDSTRLIIIDDGPQGLDSPSSSSSISHGNTTSRSSYILPSEAREQSPYHDWQQFKSDFSLMLQDFRIFVYPHAYNHIHPFSNIFLPNADPHNPKIRNYFSEHMFKISLLNSSFVTTDASQAHLFFLPFSINALRMDPRVKTEASIAEFAAAYVTNVSREFIYWNRTSGVDHFYACCHSVGKNAASMLPSLKKNAVQVACSASYFLRGYVAHKDVAMPQVWPRTHVLQLVPPQNRTRLAFHAGRTQNSEVRKRLLRLYRNDLDLDIYDGQVKGSYEEALQKARFCLHVKGYEVNTARIADAIHFGCVPVIISDHYDLPFANVLDWTKFAIIISHVDLSSMKAILTSVTEQQYNMLSENVGKVREHFQWTSSGYDAFHMTMYQLWMKRGFLRPA